MAKRDEMDLTPQDLAAIAQTRAEFIAFLNLHFTTLPDLAFVERLYEGEVQAALQSLMDDESVEPDIAAGAGMMRSFLESHRSEPKAKLSEMLGVERTRLYRGVGQAFGPPPPYEMVWSRQAQGFEVLQAVAAEYRKVGLEPAEDAKDRLDYIGLEMQFLRELALREAATWEEGEEQKSQELLTLQHAFLNNHLGSWAPDFIEKALEMAETDFYRGHLKMMRGFLNAQKVELDMLASDLE